ncbi:MAG: TQO small subunit DoxA domain-containing protein [Conexivisphaera sp.]
MDKYAVAVAVFIVIATGLTLASYQVFFHGFTNLTNYSKTPGYDLQGTRLFSNGTLELQISRVDGPDTYGGFIVLVQILYPNGTVLYQWNASQLGHVPQSDISNEFPLHPVHSDGFALVVPLGQNATVILQAHRPIPSGTYVVRVYDVDGQYAAYGQKFQAVVTVS